jgi:hypothetical protein
MRPQDSSNFEEPSLGYGMTMPDEIDLVDLLRADHHNLRDSLDDEGFLSALVEHLTVERALLYPEIEHSLAGGGEAVTRLRATDTSLEEIAQAQNGGSSEALRVHAEGQDALFSQLREAVSPERLIELARQVPLVMAEAPTHFHRHIPDHGPLREIASEIAASVDQIEDRLGKKE